MKTNPKENYKFIHHAFVRELDTMLHLLQKAIDFSKEKNMEEGVILASKLAPDMFDFRKQIQVFTDNVAGGVARGAGLSKPSMPDTENTLEELIARTQKTKDFILSVDPEKVEGVENVQVKLPWMPDGMFFDAHTYLGDFVMQNATFHFVVAYCILRNLGVQIGKQDYMGPLEMKNA
jgi:hypothetical protein